MDFITISLIGIQTHKDEIPRNASHAMLIDRYIYFPFEIKCDEIKNFCIFYYELDAVFSVGFDSFLECGCKFQEKEKEKNQQNERHRGTVCRFNRHRVHFIC